MENIKKPILKVKFVDFWPKFNPNENFFISLLSKYFDVELSDRPEVLFFSNFGFTYIKYTCPKIYYTGENSRPNYKICNYSISFENDSNKNLRLPLYVVDYDLNLLKKPIDKLSKETEKLQFCNMVVSNSKCKFRNRFFSQLSKYKKIDSGGKYKNNIGYRVDNKLEFIGKYKFSLAFENSSTIGYTTEKIVQPMLVGSIPIYWGNPKISDEFNTKSFISIHDFSSVEQAIEYIIEIDKDNSLYNKILNEPFLKNGELNNFQDPDIIGQTLKNKINNLILLNHPQRHSRMSIFSDELFVFLRRLKYHNKNNSIF